MDPTANDPPRIRRRACGVALLLAVVAALLTAPAARAISGGQAVAAGEFGFVAEVRNTQASSLCTGTLVDPNWVLTASHCATPQTPSDVTVRVGNKQLGTGGEFRNVNDIRRDPGYTGGHNDVALLHLVSPITTIAPVKLAEPAIAYRWDGAGGDTGIAMGWGETASGSGASPTLLKANVPIKPAVIDGAGIPMIPVGPGPCQGDSGGPLLVRNPQNELVQVGALKAASCGSSGSYSEVGAGPNRDWLLSRLAHYTPFGVADYDRDGKPDLIARDNGNGVLWMFPGQGGRTAPAARVAIGIDYTDYTPFGVADWDRDGTSDVVVRNDSTGDLLMFRGPGRRDWLGTASRIGNGWGMATSFDLADWNGDRWPDIVEREDAGGDLKMFPSVGGANYPGQWVKIGNGWRNETSFGLADWDRNGTTDIITRDNATGNLRMFQGTGRAAYPSSVTQIGNGWAPATSWGAGDWDGDGKADIVTRRDAGSELWMFPGRGVAGYPDPPVSFGTGF